MNACSLLAEHLVAPALVPVLGIHDDAAASSETLVRSSCCVILRVSDLVSKACASESLPDVTHV
jgi:hypothetical protein